MVSVKVAVRIGHRWEREEKPELGEKWGKLKLILAAAAFLNNLKRVQKFSAQPGDISELPQINLSGCRQELKRSTTVHKMQVVNRNQTFIREQPRLL